MRRERIIKRDRQFARQFTWMTRQWPRTGRFLGAPGLVWLRVPFAILLILGGFLAILPIFGLWMIPTGLMLLALDVPVFRRPVTIALVRGRRCLARFRRRHGAH